VISSIVGFDCTEVADAPRLNADWAQITGRQIIPSTAIVMDAPIWRSSPCAGPGCFTDTSNYPGGFKLLQRKTDAKRIARFAPARW
jgi:hypothetical protein